MAGTTVTAEPSAVALGISFQLQMENRILAMQSHLPVDADAATINAFLDKITKAADRIEAVYAINNLRKQVDMEKKAREMTIAQKAKLDARHNNNLQIASTNGRRQPLKLSAQEEAAKNTLETNLAAHGARLEAWEQQIAELQDRINGAA